MFRFYIGSFFLIYSEFMEHVLYKVIQNDCGGFNNLSYTIHLR